MHAGSEWAELDVCGVRAVTCELSEFFHSFCSCIIVGLRWWKLFQSLGTLKESKVLSISVC